MPGEQSMRAAKVITDQMRNCIDMTGYRVAIPVVPSIGEIIDREFAPLVALAGELVETLQTFMRWSEPLAKYAGSRWAENNGLSQPCHWLNETSKEAAVLLDRAREMGIPAPTRDERNCDKCDGSGKVMSPAPWIDEAELITCSACDGTGIDRAMAGEKEAKDA